ncbi:MAG TPA: hypothetical protein VLS89_16645, partial [Candidatus Nanopelagicales bacterium]|nr:hypothetical protein [Candidatus Nanopelagicales bacterium]
MMRARQWLVGGLFALCAAMSAGGCSGSKGQLMLVFQTDMSLPKDVDAIRLLVTLEGAVVFDETYTRLGTEEGIRLPATLGFLTPDDPSQALSLRVIATRGGEDRPVVLREVVTTVPEARTATLRVPIQFLCYGQAEVVRDANGNVEKGPDDRPVVRSSCGEGKTCIDGACVEPPVIAPEELPDYEPAEVFGGGSGDGDGLCFDTVRCFEGWVSAGVYIGPGADGLPQCQADIPAGLTANLNVALLTQGGGICGQASCYVPLDAGSDGGFRAEGASIRLPSAVCERAAAGKLLGLAVAQAQEGEGTCQQKTSGLPTCGAWSASGAGQYTEPDRAQPLPIALGLRKPLELAVTSTWVVWTEAGSFDENDAPLADGLLRGVPPDGGEPQTLAEGLVGPRAIAVDEAAQLVFVTTAGATADDGGILAAGLGLPAAIPLLSGRRQPEGIARQGNALIWTELWGGEVLEVGTSGTGAAITVQGEPASRTPGGALGVAPYRVAAAADVVCWTYQSTLGFGDGAVACQRAGEAAQVVASQQSTPRAIALDVDGSGSAQAVYWANFEGGTISRVSVAGAQFGAPEVVAEGQALPNGIAVDEQFVYWTNQGDGTVQRAAKGGGEAEEIASEQARPGAIAT